MVMTMANKNAPKQALQELQSILKKPYQDICNVCKGTGEITDHSSCPKCKGTGKRLLKLL